MQANSANRHSSIRSRFTLCRSGLTLICEGLQSHRMEAGDSCVIPVQQRHALTDCSDDLELLEAKFPAEL